MQMAMQTTLRKMQMLDETFIYDYSYQHQALFFWGT